MSERGCLGRLVIAGIGGTFAGFMLTILLAVAIWPGEAKLVAPLLCPDDQPDAFVVTDTYNPAPGETTTNYTLYCMGPRGETTDLGFAIPMVILTAGHTAVLLLLFGALGVRGARRARAKHPGLDLEDAVRAELAESMGEPEPGHPAALDDDRGGGSSGAPVDSPIDDGTIPPGPIIS